jgi:hypothetical protein
LDVRSPLPVKIFEPNPRAYEALVVKGCTSALARELLEMFSRTSCSSASQVAGWRVRNACRPLDLACWLERVPGNCSKTTRRF